jgi:hypothetical protein
MPGSQSPQALCATGEPMTNLFSSANAEKKNDRMKEIKKGAMALTLILTFTGAGTSNAQKPMKTDEQIALDHGFRMLDKDLIAVTFEQGSAELSKDSLAKLNDFVKSTSAEAKVEKYIVAAWSDSAYPSKKDVSRVEEALAVARSMHIKEGLSASGADKVDAFQMTKEPNWIQRAFGTQATELKGQGWTATAYERVLKDMGEKLREKGGPRTAVVVVKFRNDSQLE